MSKAELNDDLIAVVAGDITVYHFDELTGEYHFPTTQYLPVGVGLPAHSCFDAPPAPKDGFAIRRTADGSAWEYLSDHRGDTVYNTQTRQPVTLTTLGAYPENTTPLAPATEYDIWDGTNWVLDVAAKQTGEIAEAEQRRQTLLTEADNVTSDWRVELMLGDISDDNKTKLSAWMAYKSAVNAVDVSTAPDVSWPAQPDK
ncbi:tail fiber assembly protein [Lonsdalea iberica]|uniref:Phage tail protein n=1 Tax=Lonsdalea iberica TaxID=1082703 RepID=A0A1X3RH36_9GAMM|nr:tail fiber assembly protein [Lonsdalea iberica]OSN01074.1 phage tail protein [Lonsdalea iberica]